MQSSVSTSLRTYSDQVQCLSPAGELDTTKSIDDGLTQEFLKCTGVYDLSILSAIDFLEFKQNEIESHSTLICTQQLIRMMLYFCCKKSNML